MAIKSHISDYQRQRRDGGWRINTIPWWKAGDIQQSVSTLLSKCIGLLGFVFLLGPIALTFTQVIPFEYLPWAIVGVLLLFVATFFNTWDVYRKFVALDAKVVDYEVREVFAERPSSNSPRIKVWAFRLVCDFTFEGKHYIATPDVREDFKTERQLLAFFKQTISGRDDNLRTRIFVDPKNPLHCVFHKRPILPGNYA